MASLRQNQCHRHLASLPKYTLPNEGMFEYLVCPHYTCEVGVYVALALITAPKGMLINKTMLCVTAFVLINLGGTAVTTREWYAQKFGAKRIAKKYNMIPYVF